MTERENLPTLIAVQPVAVLSEQRGSLVARGMAAVRKDIDALYRQAREAFNMFERSKVDGISWDATDNPDISSAFKIFQQLANQNYGKAYYPLSILYEHKCQNIEECQARAKHYSQLAFDWCFANQACQDLELWCDLGIMYIEGHGVVENFEQGDYWLCLAKDQGYVRAKSFYTMSLLQRLQGKLKNPKVQKLLQEHADQLKEFRSKEK